MAVVIDAGQVQVQLWAPQLDPSPLRRGLEQAHLQVRLCLNADAVTAESPLLLVYAEPLQMALQPDLPCATEGYAQLLQALPLLQQRVSALRLVNLDVLALPSLVGWCVERPVSEPPVGDPSSFPWPEPDALAACVACRWLDAEPQVLLDYQQLEAHPLAAALDLRAPDQGCLDRYRRASSRPALLRAIRQQQELQADLQELAAELTPRRMEQLQALELREQLQQVRAALQAAEQAQGRCQELELSLQVQQADQEQLARRLTLLEALVADGSAASERLQLRLAQLLS